MSARRAVLVTQRARFAGGTAPERLRHDLDAAAALGIEITAIVDVADARRAHQLVADGEVDLIVYSRDDLPSVVRLGIAGRTVQLRDGESPDSARFRRPQLISQRTQIVDRTQPVELPTAPDPGAVPHTPGPEPLTPPVRRRAAESHRSRRRRSRAG
jgi:hypothetical protein